MCVCIFNSISLNLRYFIAFPIIYTVTDAQGNIVVYQYQPEGEEYRLP